MQDWYLPREITFTTPQCIFLIIYLPLLHEGRYPPENRETGYEGSNPNRKTHAPFEIASGFAAEITYRLDKCGRDGEKLVKCIQQNEEMSLDAQSALRYIRGYKRKLVTYYDWCQWNDLRFQIKRKQDQLRRLKVGAK